MQNTSNQICESLQAILLVDSVWNMYVWEVGHVVATCSTAADSGKVKMKDQQIETETVDTKDQYVQAGSMALQQGK